MAVWNTDVNTVKIIKQGNEEEEIINQCVPYNDFYTKCVVLLSNQLNTHTCKYINKTNDWQRLLFF